MDIFSSRPGSVVAISGFTLPPCAFFLESWAGLAFNSLITQVGVRQQGGYQFLHTLRDFIYLYVFGERIGEMTISGITYAINCQREFADVLPQAHGSEWVNAYYQVNRVTTRARPLTIVMGISTPFQAFLLGSNTSIDNPDPGLGQFTLNLAVIPRQGLTL